MEAKSEFENNGFVVIKNIIDKNQIDKCVNILNDLYTYTKNNFQDPFLDWSLPHRSDQGVFFDVYQRHPEFRGLLSEEVTEQLAEIIGDNFFLYDNTVVFKPGKSKNDVPWHQDFISRETEPNKVVIWVPLQDVNEENGTLRFFPGSHRNGRKKWHRIPGETHHDRIIQSEIEELMKDEQPIYANMKKGDLLVFHNLVVHGSKKTDSLDKRYVFRCSFQSCEEAIFTPRQSPIVIKGCNPKFLMSNYNQPKKKEKAKILQLINKVGLKLSRL